MKLSKKERFLAYSIMLAEAENPSNFILTDIGNVRKSNECGLCFMFKLLWDSDDLYFKREETLPELADKLAEESQYIPYTEEGWQKRIELLKQCINETAI
jgi:hypothetical protein